MTMREEMDAVLLQCGTTGVRQVWFRRAEAEAIFQAAYAAGQREEREACAKACESVAAQWSFHAVAPSAAHNCAAGIRNRKEQG